MQSADAKTSALPFDALIIAAGATDRVMAVPGWTLPGVYSLGAAQIALKAQACAIGRKVAFLGTGPLLYLVAHQYAEKARIAVRNVRRDGMDHLKTLEKGHHMSEDEHRDNQPQRPKRNQQDAQSPGQRLACRDRVRKEKRQRAKANQHQADKA